MERVVLLKFEKETKGTVRYKEVELEGKEMVIGTLYIKKGALTTPYPDEVTVTISY